MWIQKVSDSDSDIAVCLGVIKVAARRIPLRWENKHNLSQQTSLSLLLGLLRLLVESDLGAVGRLEAWVGGCQSQPSPPCNSALVICSVQWFSSILTPELCIKTMWACSNHNLPNQPRPSDQTGLGSVYLRSSSCCPLIKFCLLPSRQQRRRKEFWNLHLLLPMPKASVPFLQINLAFAHLHYSVHTISLTCSAQLIFSLFSVNILRWKEGRNRTCLLGRSPKWLSMEGRRFPQSPYTRTDT